MDVFILNRFLILFFIVIKISAFSQEYSDISMNEIRILASHNSYKIKPTERTLKFISRFGKFLSDDNKPFQLNYGHATLIEQLNDYNIRGFELDVYNDPKGKRYFKHPLNFFIPKQKVRSQTDSIMKNSGFKILHIPDIDYLTNYKTLEQALDELNEWSIQNPTHAPIFINIELKGSAMGDEVHLLRLFGFHKAVQFDKTTLLEMDSIFKKKLTTLFPSNIFKENYTSNQERISSIGWPKLTDVRGKIFVIVQGQNSHLYPIENAGAFVYGDKKDPNCIFLLKDNSQGIEQEISELTKSFMIRTRSDAGTIEARNNDYSRLNAALKSGAQIISTDFYRKDLTIGEFVIPQEYFIK